MSILRREVARVFQPLLEPARYKGAHGGRGSAKSHFFAEQMIEDSLYFRGLRSVCVREVQKTLEQSAKQLILDKLQKFHLGEAQDFKVFKDRVQTPGDGIIIFQGMQDHNAESIKSLEGFNRLWGEESQTMSRHSLELIRPTIRSDDSELWFSWNPRRQTDVVDALFRAGTAPTNSICVESNWRDNPWFPEVLKQERLDCKRDEPDEYDHIWEGAYKTITKGAYFAEHLNNARRENRLGRVARDPLMNVKLFMDIGGTGGKSDAFTIWAAQWIGKEIRVLKYYEAQGQDIATHLNWMMENKYLPHNTTIYLPHDGGTNDRVYSVSYESAFKSAGYAVKVITNQGKGAAKQRIEAVRRLFPNIWIDSVECEGGILALGSYHEKWDEARNIGLGPNHDWASHGSDAFGLMCVAYKAPKVNNGPRKQPKISVA